MNSLVDDPILRRVLDRLHAASEAQDADIARYYDDGADRPTGFEAVGEAGRQFWLDKFVALERDKAELVYALARATGARRIVEAGTSFGVSTLYLAAAVRDGDIDGNGEGGLVTTCDIEESKVEVARRHFEEAGLADLIEIRVGDVRETLVGLDGPVDLLLLDIWAPIAGAVARLVDPVMPAGAVVVADNTVARRDGYADLLSYLADGANGFTSATLPYDGGLEVAVKTG